MLPCAGMNVPPIPDILKLFTAAVDEEINATRKSGRHYSISDGQRLSQEGSRILYKFSTKARLATKDDSDCTLILNEERIKGIVVSGGQGTVTISVEQALGREIPKAKLELDETQLLKGLRSALADLSDPEKRNDWNEGLANRTLGQAKSQKPPYRGMRAAPRDLTPDQTSALATVFTCETTYLWGPPGTGKTHTLGAIAHALYQAGLRILVVAHTNQAVDGVLESLCKRLTDDGLLPLADEKFLRMGSIVRDSLRERWGGSISFDEILSRKEDLVHDEIKSLEKKSLETGAELERLNEMQRQWQERETVRDAIEALNRKMTGYRGAVRKLIGHVTGNHTSLSIELQRDFQELQRQRHLLEKLDTALHGLELEECENTILNLEDRRDDLGEKVLELQEGLQSIKTDLITNARVIAMSTTQAFLRARNLTNFDVILIDEASMVPLPIAYYLGGIPTERVVIAGDFRQLPPIARSEADVVTKWYARDIFFAAGVVDDVNARRSRENLAKLTSQFRSHSDLCALINERFYSGELTSRFTDTTNLTFHPAVEYLRDNRIVLVDTSNLDGAGQYVEKSKSNLMHALLIRRLCGELAKMGDEAHPASIGVIAPYRPQVDLLQGILTERALSGVAVGTVHRFQGDERAVMILDLTENSPHTLGAFFQATSIADDGARLLNVALSRAQRNLIVVANLNYFKKQLRPTHILRGVLDDIAARGMIIRGEVIAGSESVAGEATTPERQIPYYPQTQYFNAHEFGAAFQADVKEATRELVIVSAFVSANRIKAVRDVLADRTRAGVSVTAIVPPERENGTINSHSYNEALSILKNIGVRVLVKSRIHAKVICIDQEVVWIGSLNPLSYNGSNSEVMVRDLSPIAYASALEQFKHELGLEKTFHH